MGLREKKRVKGEEEGGEEMKNRRDASRKSREQRGSEQKQQKL